MLPDHPAARRGEGGHAGGQGQPAVLPAQAAGARTRTRALPRRTAAQPRLLTARSAQSIAYYLDTIIGGDGLLYQPSEAAASPGGARGSAPGARDRAARAAAASVSTALRAPSCALVPYKAAFELRRILTNWVNAYGASAAALIVGPCGSMVSSADPHIAAATDKWCAARRVEVRADMACALIPCGRAGTRTRIRRNSQPCSSSGRTTSRVAKTTCACRTYGSTAFCATTTRCENCAPSCLGIQLAYAGTCCDRRAKARSSRRFTLSRWWRRWSCWYAHASFLPAGSGLIHRIALQVLAHPRWPADATKRFAAPPETVRSALLQEVPLGYLRACAGSLPAGIPRSVELDAGLLG